MGEVYEVETELSGLQQQFRQRDCHSQSMKPAQRLKVLDTYNYQITR